MEATLRGSLQPADLQACSDRITFGFDIQECACESSTVDSLAITLRLNLPPIKCRTTFLSRFASTCSLFLAGQDVASEFDDVGFHVWFVWPPSGILGLSAVRSVQM